MGREHIRLQHRNIVVHTSSICGCVCIVMEMSRNEKSESIKSWNVFELVKCLRRQINENDLIIFFHSIFSRWLQVFINHLGITIKKFKIVSPEYHSVSATFSREVPL